MNSDEYLQRDFNGLYIKGRNILFQILEWLSEEEWISEKEKDKRNEREIKTYTIDEAHSA